MGSYRYTRKYVSELGKKYFIIELFTFAKQGINQKVLLLTNKHFVVLIIFPS